MIKKAIFSTMIATVLIVSLAQSSHQATEIVFEENFDGVLSGWIETVCNRNDPPTQVCILGQATVLFDPPNEPAPSAPNWGFVEIFAGGGGGVTTPIEIRYQKTFNVAEEDDYDVSAWLGIKDCSGCNISTQLYIDGILVLERIGPNLDNDPVGPHDFFEQSVVHFTAGSHNIEMAMFSTGAISGHFRASFDEILIQRTIQDTPEQLRAIDKATNALEDACVKIQREINHLNTKGQAIPIEIVELELRACGP